MKRRERGRGRERERERKRNREKERERERKREREKERKRERGKERKRESEKREREVRDDAEGVGVDELVVRDDHDHGVKEVHLRSCVPPRAQPDNLHSETMLQSSVVYGSEYFYECSSTT